MRIVTPAGSRWASNYYITLATGSSDQLEFRAWSQCSRSYCGNQLSTERLGPRPLVEQPRKTKKTQCYGRRSWRSICCSLFSVSNSLSYTTLSIKWEVYFSKELCLLVFMALLCFCLHMCMYSCSWLYNKTPLMLEFWGMWSTSPLPSLPGPLWPGVVASDRVL